MKYVFLLLFFISASAYGLLVVTDPYRDIDYNKINSYDMQPKEKEDWCRCKCNKGFTW